MPPPPQANSTQGVQAGKPWGRGAALGCLEGQGRQRKGSGLCPTAGAWGALSCRWRGRKEEDGGLGFPCGDLGVLHLQRPLSGG